MTRRNRAHYAQVANAPSSQRAQLAIVNRSIDEQCRYRDQCLAFAADAERRLETLKEEQLRLVKALGMAPEEGTK